MIPPNSATYGSRVRATVRLAGALAVAALAVAGCGSGATAASGHSDSASVSVSAAPQGRYAGVTLPKPYQRPSFTLTDQDGKPFDFAAVTKGKPTLLYFGYTHCPDVCPTTMADIAVALRTVKPELARQVQVVFVTTDPKRDTPAVLGEYMNRFDSDLPVRFTGLTGSQADVDAAQQAAGVPVAQDDGATHSALLLLYGQDDKAHVAFDSGNSSKDIAHDLPLVAGAA